MKSLFDRTRVYAYPAADGSGFSDDALNAADGIVVSVRCEGSLPVPAECGFDDMDDLLRMCAERQLHLLLVLEDAPDAEARKFLMTAVCRREMVARLTLASRHHRCLDEMKQAEPALRITPLCDDTLVRPWIYAAYMGAPAYCTDAEALLRGADRFGCETVDRAHNANVCIFAENAEDADTVKALVSVGCDAVLTHDPVMARALVW